MFIKSTIIISYWVLVDRRLTLLGFCITKSFHPLHGDSLIVINTYIHTIQKEKR